MKNCTDCKYALWKRTKAGKLHSGGDGKCDYEYRVPKLPASMYWIGSTNTEPSPSGGLITRRRDMDSHCSYWARAA